MGSPQPLDTEERLQTDQPPAPAMELPETPRSKPKAYDAPQPWVHDIYLVAVLIATFVLDQVSKELVRDNIIMGGSIPSEGFFRLTHISNTGSAFGLFPNQAILLAVASLAGIAILILFYRHQPLPSMWLRTSLGLQLGGAAGNLADRITLGGVTDFIDIGAWPVFNLADSAIVVGIAILAWMLLSNPKRPPTNDPAVLPRIEDDQKPPLDTENKLLSLVYYPPTPEAAEERLDSYIPRVRSDLTRSQAQRLIREGSVLVNGMDAKASFGLRPGDHIEVRLPPPPPTWPGPEEMPIDVRYRDDDVLVIEKPPGMTVHPAPGRPSGTLVNALLASYPDLAEAGERLRPGIVHRLDADTSGLMVVARTEAAYNDLSRQIKARAVTKVYLALVLGHPEPSEAVIEAPIGRDPRNRKRMAVVEGGRQATTRYHITRLFDAYALLEITPHTGRTHQIRVHLSSIGPSRGG